jgi:hypothetical protein
MAKSKSRVMKFSVLRARITMELNGCSHVEAGAYAYCVYLATTSMLGARVRLTAKDLDGADSLGFGSKHYLNIHLDYVRVSDRSFVVGMIKSHIEIFNGLYLAATGKQVGDFRARRVEFTRRKDQPSNLDGVVDTMAAEYGFPSVTQKVTMKKWPFYRAAKELPIIYWWVNNGSTLDGQASVMIKLEQLTRQLIGDKHAEQANGGDGRDRVWSSDHEGAGADDRQRADALPEDHADDVQRDGDS